MKYKLITGNGVNDMLIHHTMKSEMKFDNLKDAEKAFHEEVKELSEAYKSLDALGFTYDDVKESEKVRTKVYKINDEENEIIFESVDFLIEN